MANLSASTSLRQIGKELSLVQVEILNGAKIWQGAMVCRVTASGYGVRAGTASTGAVQGIARDEAAIPATDGAVNVDLLTGIFARPADATHPPVLSDLGKVVYAKDDYTISRDAGDGPVAGLLVGFEDSSGDPLVYIHPAMNVLLDSTDDASADLASIVNGEGASLIGVEDAGAFTTAATVEAALAELYQDVKSATVKKEIPLSAILAAGTPMAAWADDAAASSPGVTLANSKAMGLRWNNFATQIAVFLRFNLPHDIDITANASIEVYASKTGATGGDATTFDIALFNNASTALHDADTDYGGATGAMTGAATAKTVQKVTRTLTASDLGVAGEPVTMSIKPTNGTLGTDDVIIEGINLVYKRKVKTS